jgi:antibiotic biosynthesis monooxygenase (ABM) superfamily enzyme
MTTSPMATPPPKYKLFLVIWVAVYISNLTNALAGDKVSNHRENREDEFE